MLVLRGALKSSGVQAVARPNTSLAASGQLHLLVARGCACCVSVSQVTRDSGAGADRERLRRERQQQKKSQWNFWHNNRNQDRIQYTSSVDIRPEWPVLEQIQLSALTKLTGTPPKGEPEQLAQCGHLEYYDKNYDRIGAKQEVRFEKGSRSRRQPAAETDETLLCWHILHNAS